MIWGLFFCRDGWVGYTVVFKEYNILPLVTLPTRTLTQPLENNTRFFWKRKVAQNDFGFPDARKQEKQYQTSIPNGG